MKRSMVLIVMVLGAIGERPLKAVEEGTLWWGGGATALATALVSTGIFYNYSASSPKKLETRVQEALKNLDDIILRGQLTDITPAKQRELILREVNFETLNNLKTALQRYLGNTAVDSIKKELATGWMNSKMRKDLSAQLPDESKKQTGPNKHIKNLNVESIDLICLGTLQTLEDYIIKGYGIQTNPEWRKKAQECLTAWLLQGSKGLLQVLNEIENKRKWSFKSFTTPSYAYLSRAYAALYIWTLLVPPVVEIDRGPKVNILN